ncbi:MAG: hypothetical protein H6998_17775 [Hahellaceae bacterium]|nr:hypothetical protein [Hahellaceae bacterium]
MTADDAGTDGCAGFDFDGVTTFFCCSTSSSSLFNPNVEQPVNRTEPNKSEIQVLLIPMEGTKYLTALLILIISFIPFIHMGESSFAKQLTANELLINP